MFAFEDLLVSNLDTIELVGIESILSNPPPLAIELDSIPSIEISEISKLDS